MYVIYPADELLRIYECPEPRDEPPCSTVRTPLLTVDGGERRSGCQAAVIAVNAAESAGKQRHEGDARKGRRRDGRTTRRARRASKGIRGEQRVTARTMQNSRAAAAEDPGNPLKDLTQPGLNEPLKQHNAATLKLVQTGEWTDFFSLFFFFFFFQRTRV